MSADEEMAGEPVSRRWDRHSCLSTSNRTAKHTAFTSNRSATLAVPFYRVVSEEVAGEPCKPDSIMWKSAKSPRVFKLGITICHYVV